MYYSIHGDITMALLVSSPWTMLPVAFLMKSQPAVMFPHWSLPPSWQWYTMMWSE